MERLEPTRRQKPVKGGRAPLPSLVIGKIRRNVEREAQRYNVSRSFVVAVILADFFGISDQEHYGERPWRRG